MRRDQTTLVRAPRVRETLSSTRWRRMYGVRHPATTDVADELVVGPSGVHVCVHAHDVASVDPADPVVLARATSVATAAAAVTTLLPPRYAHAVRPAVCVCEADEAGAVADGVPVLSPDAWRHTVEHAPRVLSTSEVTIVADLLVARLEAVVAAPTVRPRTWRRWWLAAGAGVLAAGATAAEVAGLTPWW